MPPVAKPRRILLPEYLDDQLKDLPTAPFETRGSLLYTPISNLGGTSIDFMAEALFANATGLTSHPNDPQSEEILRTFLGRNLIYQTVELHTHCTSANTLFPRFTSGDIESYTLQLRKNKRFIGMMVSPAKRLLYCHGDVKVEVVPNPDGFDENKKKVLKELDNIRLELGYGELPILRVN